MNKIGACTVLAVSLILPLSSCSFEAVGQFADKSSQALAEGPPLLKDLEGSCLRRELNKGPYYGMDQPELAAKAHERAAATCAELVEHTPGLLAASRTLTDYFSAISQLAAGKSADGKSAQSDKEAASQAKKTPESVTLLNASAGIADAIGKIATAGYRNKHLKTDLQKAAADVEVVLRELKKDGDERYRGLLDSEQRGYEDRINVAMQDLGQGGENDPPQLKLVRILARDEESENARQMDAKRSAATEYGKAIDAILAGHKALVDHNGSLDAKDLPGIIQPYTDSLSKLAKSILQVLGGGSSSAH